MQGEVVKATICEPVAIVGGVFDFCNQPGFGEGGDGPGDGTVEGAELRYERGRDYFVVFGAEFDGGEYAPVVGGEVADMGSIELHDGRQAAKEGE